MSDKPAQALKEDKEEAVNGDVEDEMIDMDGKTNALANLLKTSSVSSALASHKDALPLTSM